MQMRDKRHQVIKDAHPTGRCERCGARMSDHPSLRRVGSHTCVAPSPAWFVAIDDVVVGGPYRFGLGVKHDVDRWVDDGELTAYLEPLIRGRMVLGFGMLDDANRRDVVDIVSYLFNEAPALCWGREDSVERWRAHLAAMGKIEHAQEVSS